MISLRTTVLFAAGLPLLSLAGPAASQNKLPAPTKITPKLEAIAETKLLMEGLAHANFRGMEQILNQKPAQAQSWTFARGQALLLAETANLLMLRPPKSQGQAAWFERAMELRTQATHLAKIVAQKDFEGSRTGLINLAGTCNRCHQTFRVAIEITAFTAPPADK